MNSIGSYFRRASTPNVGSVRQKKPSDKRRKSADSKFMLFSTGTSKVAPTGPELDNQLPTLTEGKSEKSGKENILPSFLTFHMTAKEEWKLENHGGVKMWVNTKTNEVSLTNPKNDVKKTPVHRADVTLRVKAGPVPTGTASNLYDSRAVKELFAMLDKEEKK